jgi:hypothetical protein
MRAALILVGLAALVVMELGTPPRKPKPVHEPLSQLTVGSSVSRDTLTPADRLEIHHVRNEAPLRPISPIETSVPLVQAATTAQEPPKNIDQPKRSATARKSAVLLPRPRPKQRISRTTVNANRSQATAEVKSCRPGAFDSLLRAFSLSPGCES